MSCFCLQYCIFLPPGWFFWCGDADNQFQVASVCSPERDPRLLSAATWAQHSALVKQQKCCNQFWLQPKRLLTGVKLGLLTCALVIAHFWSEAIIMCFYCLFIHIIVWSVQAARKCTAQQKNHSLNLQTLHLLSWQGSNFQSAAGHSGLSAFNSRWWKNPVYCWCVWWKCWVTSSK